MNCLKRGASVLLFFVLSLSTQIAVAQEKYELVKLETEDGGSIEASLFKASESRIVIFAHGAIFNKESWYFLAEKFQLNGISALPIDFRGYGNSKAGTTDKKLFDILGVIAYAKAQGYTDINIIGASMGGTAVLGALAYKNNGINKVVLLAPGGTVIKSTQIKKLFVVSKKEDLHSRVMQIYADSDMPKQLKEFEGDAHAQHLFKTKYGDELQKLIINFLK
ncbi:MAG: alpha/beta hydrolase [Cyclobacteriaceae bacterium]|nr:alpha/beta hydrolase [Cyclobacteriaceae bacterium]